MAGKEQAVPASPTPTELEHQRLLEPHRTNGEKLKEIAARHGIPLGRLRWWKSEIARRARWRAGLAAFVPVRIVDMDREAAPDARPRGESYEVLLRGERVVRVPSGFLPSEVTALVAALEAAPC